MLFHIMADWTAWKYISAVLDIAILSFVIYKLLMLMRGTRAIQLLKGIFVILIAGIISDWIGLYAISWILHYFWTMFLVILAVVFQPELRRALERLGRGRLFANGTGARLTSVDLVRLIDEVTDTCVACAKNKTGALIILERETGLSDYISTGIAVDALVTKALLCNIFVVNTPLHDGAVIIRGDRVMAAACFLPLSDNPYINIALGTRHRAAIGLSEISDALCLVVSEETGIISLAQDGKLVRNLDDRQLRETLSEQLTTGPAPRSIFRRGGQSA